MTTDSAKLAKAVEGTRLCIQRWSGEPGAGLPYLTTVIRVEGDVVFTHDGLRWDRTTGQHIGSLNDVNNGLQANVATYANREAVHRASAIQFLSNPHIWPDLPTKELYQIVKLVNKAQPNRRPA